MIIHFPKKMSPDELIAPILAHHQRSLPSELHITLNDQGKAISHDKNQTIFTARSKPFALLYDLRQYFIQHLGLDTLLSFAYDLQKKNVFSQHIIHKTLHFLEQGKIVFRLEAQFPPDAIRRPEKNVYFANTFLQICTHVFIESQKALSQKTVFILEQAQNLDRDSLRFLQNSLLTVKTVDFKWHLIFQKNTTPNSLASESFIKARTEAFRKFFAVGVIAGYLDDALDIEKTLETIDFSSAFDDTLAYLHAEQKLNDKSAQDAVYKSRYEQFYAIQNQAEITPKCQKLTVLVDNYLYQFDAALNLCQQQEHLSPKDRCYLHLLAGLIHLKKKNDIQIARHIFQQGLLEADNITHHDEKIVEQAFLQNALNFCQVVDYFQQQNPSPDYHALLEIEHQLLQSVLRVFLSADSEKLSAKKLPYLMFILTTLLENISKLNELSGNYRDNIELYESYLSIFQTIAQRMEEKTYQTSYCISFSHAQIHNLIKVAQNYSAIGDITQALNITQSLIKTAKQYDVTGDYRAFIYHHQAIFHHQLGHNDKALEDLAQVALFAHHYNQPKWLQEALNGMFILSKNPAFRRQLEASGFITPNYSLPKKIKFYTNSAVDLENFFLVGLDEAIFNDNAVSYEKGQKIRGDMLKACFKHYGIWRQITRKG